MLWVLESNQRARRFYERAGWSWEGTRSAHQMQCANLPILRYSRPL
jgi:RimJ/RimL family protein N-acetyltransferase